MPKPTVLLVDDSETIREVVGLGLERDGYAVLEAASGKELMHQLKSRKMDVILLDLVLPDDDGLSLIAKIREHTQAPIIVISGKGEMVDKVVGLEMGADDYLSKPFQVKELSARIKAQLRRGKPVLSPGDKVPVPQGAYKINFDRWTMDRSKFQIYDEKGRSGDLTTREFQLLEVLVLADGRVLSREQILDAARANDFEVTDRAIDTQVARLRKKMSDNARDPRIIKSVRGIGYMLGVKTRVEE